LLVIETGPVAMFSDPSVLPARVNGVPVAVLKDPVVLLASA